MKHVRKVSGRPAKAQDDVFTGLEEIFGCFLAKDPDCCDRLGKSVNPL